MRISYVILLVVLLACAIAWSQPEVGGGNDNRNQYLEQRFKQMDKDGDGKLSPQEFPNAEQFKRLDANGDGFLVLGEFKAMLQQPAGQANPEEQFKRLDKNGDGKLDAQEFPNVEQFKRLDKNGDGAITLDEFKAAFAQGGGQPGGNIEETFKRLDRNGDGKLDAQELPNPEQLKRLDVNGDGFVTLEEAKARLGGQPGAGRQPEMTAEERFKQLDKNGDGVLSLEEFKAGYGPQRGALINPNATFTPLIDLGKNKYKDFTGGLYPDGANTPPADYLQKGLAAAAKVQPLNRDGQPDAAGSVVLLSIGMSNTTMEFSTFKRMADQDQAMNDRLVIVDGAQGGQTASLIRNPNVPFWTVIDQRLQAAGVSAKQVQAVWLKEANAGENRPFPQDAQGLKDDLRADIKVLQDRFPNLKLIYLSSRIYGGYATTPLNPEPAAYDSGFAVKWLIEDWMKEMAQTPNLPWVAWGPYLWTDGERGRSDKLVWTVQDCGQDGTHPSESGMRKVADLLLQFFKTDSTAKGWFMGGNAK